MAGLLAACEFAPAPGTSNSPSGYVDVVTGGQDSVRIKGWTSDWDTRNPIDVVFLINNVWTRGVTANLPRTDVAARYRRGANFGFDVTVPAPAGSLSVCVVALNVGRGQNTILGCSTTTATTPTTPTTTTTSTTTTSLIPVVLLPVIDSLSPVYGPIAGGTTVTLIGSGFTGASSVTFQGVPATSVTVVSATEVTAVSPVLAAGPADVVITTPGGSSDAPGNIDYMYIDCSSRSIGADLRGCDLTSANLSGLDLTGANLTDAFLLFADLSNTVLERANLTNTIIDTSTLRGTALEDAILDGTDFVDNDMTGSHLDRARFTGGRLRGVNLTDATLNGVDLTGVDLTGAIWSNTTCPDGSVQSTECPRTP